MIISHVRIAVSGITALAAMGVYAIVLLFPSRWVFFIMAPLWCVIFSLLVRRLARFSGDRKTSVGLAVVTTIALFSLVSIVEWPPLLWFSVLLSGVISFFLVSISLGEQSGAVHEFKELRRIHAMILTFDLGAIMTTLYAIGIFFPQVPFLLLSAIGGAFFSVASFLVWRLYHDIHIRSHALWILVFFFMMSESIWVMHLLPFSYEISGVLTTWLWYVAQLLARFHFSSQGILWKNQYVFLLTNILAYTATVVFFVRWV